MNLLLAEDRRLRPIWRFALSFFFAFYIANNVAGGVAVHAGWPPSLRFEVVYRPLWLALLLAGFSFFVVLLDRQSAPFRNMGLGRPWWHDTLKGVAIGAGMVIVGVACIAVFGTLTFGYIGYGQVALRLGAVLVVLIAAAMAEELTFRGYPFQRLLESCGAAAAVAVMSLLFGAVHLGNPNASATGFVNTVLIGGVLAAAYLRTWKLWLPFGIHLGWNLTLGTVLGLPVSGLHEFSVIVVGHARGPGWATGGSYGVEASLVGTGVILLGFLALRAFVPVVPRPEPVIEEPTALSLEPPPPQTTSLPPQSDRDTLPAETHPTE